MQDQVNMNLDTVGITRGASARRPLPIPGNEYKQVEKPPRLKMTKGRWLLMIITWPFVAISQVIFVLLNSQGSEVIDQFVRGLSKVKFEHVLELVNNIIAISPQFTLDGISKVFVFLSIVLLPQIIVFGMIVKLFFKNTSYLRCCFRVYCFYLITASLVWLKFFFLANL